MYQPGHLVKTLLVFINLVSPAVSWTPLICLQHITAGKAAAAAARCRAPTGGASVGASDWGRLPTAIAASRAGALNSQIVKAAEAEAVLALVEQNEPVLSAVNCATALHRLGSHLKVQRVQRDRVLRDRRFAGLLAATADRAAGFNPRSVSDVLWACATLGVWPPELLKPVLTQVAAHLERDELEAQHLALIVWSFAVLECKPVVLLNRIELRAAGRLRNFNAQNCANVLWGFAKLQHTPRMLLPAITAKLAAPAFLAQLKPVEVADLSFALSSLGTAEAQGPLLRELAGLAMRDTALASFTSRQLVTLLAAFARLGERPPQLEEWAEAVRGAHKRKPLLARDQAKLEEALQAFDEVGHLD